MGQVSGFNFSYNGQSILVAGDTIWCEALDAALKTHQPNYVVLNTGDAQFLKGDPITMTQKDIQQVVEIVPNSKLIAVHMDTVNHCFLS